MALIPRLVDLKAVVLNEGIEVVVSKRAGEGDEKEKDAALIGAGECDALIGSGTADALMGLRFEVTGFGIGFRFAAEVASLKVLVASSC